MESKATFITKLQMPNRVGIESCTGIEVFQEKKNNKKIIKIIKSGNSK